MLTTGWGALRSLNSTSGAEQQILYLSADYPDYAWCSCQAKSPRLLRFNCTRHPQEVRHDFLSKSRFSRWLLETLGFPRKGANAMPKRPSHLGNTGSVDLP
jgi:hypothetical protein